MFRTYPNAWPRAVPLAVSLLALWSAHPAFGQTANQAASSDDQTVTSEKKTDSKQPKVSDARPTSPNSTINLVNLLVKQGVIKQDQADQLIKQAFEIGIKDYGYIPLHQQPLSWGVSKKVKMWQRADNQVLFYWATKTEE